ncbi:MAG: hypothetical protein AAF688_08005 [Bacteroidota bacterium]
MNVKLSIIFISLMVILNSCKSEPKSTETNISEEQVELRNDNSDGKTEKQADGLIAIQGNFIFYDNAAVLQTPARMFGVVVNDKMHELDKQVQQYKNEPTDMIPVTIRGRIFKKLEGEEGWEDRIEIMEILKVIEPKPEDNQVIKIGGEASES